MIARSLNELPNTEVSCDLGNWIDPLFGCGIHDEEKCHEENQHRRISFARGRVVSRMQRTTNGIV
jgi:hypothetical protein